MVLAVPAASLRCLDHPHHTFPFPSHRYLSLKTLRTPTGSAILENRPTKPGHHGQGASSGALPSSTKQAPSPTSWPLSHGPQSPTTRPQSIGLQPHSARERLRRKRLFSHLKKSQENKGKTRVNLPMVLAVPAASLRRRRHSHDTVPYPYDR